MSKTFPYAYIRKKICRISDATIPIQARFVQYGMGIFTGIRGQYNAHDKKVYLFRLDEHYRRLIRNSKIVNMKFALSYSEFQKIIFDLIAKNKVKEDLYLRAILYASTTEIAPRFDNSESDFAVYMLSLKNYLDTENGLNVCISSWRRFDDDMISTKAKIHGGYANSAFAKTEASLKGFDDAIFLNRKGFVCEGTSTNIFGVKNGTLYTPPLSANNLDGITRKSILTFAKDLGLKVKQKKIIRRSLYNFDELFLCGTATRIAWIRSVDKKIIGRGKLGVVTKSLKEIFEKASRGEIAKYRKWLT